MATLARLSPGDPHLRKLVGSYRDALHACAVVTHAVARAIESGQTPSMATQRALYKATQASDQAAGAIEDYCTVHAPPR